MASLMILPNPKPRRRRRGAKRKMTPLQLKYFGKRKKKKSAAAPATVVVATSNPKKGSKMAKKRRVRRHRRHYNKNPRPMRRYRRNPIGGGVSGFLTGTLIPASVGAAGALATDLLIGNLPIPAQYRQGAMLSLIRIGAALGVGAIVGAVAGEDAGTEAAAGAVVVTLYGMTRNYLANNMPQLRLARYVPLKGMGRRKIRGMAGMGRGRRRRGMGFIVNQNRVPRGLGVMVAKRRARLARVRNRMSGAPATRMRQGRGNLGYVGPSRTMSRDLGRYVNK